MTRTGLFKMLGSSLAGAAGIALLADPSAHAATLTPGTTKTDLAILQYAVTLETLGVGLYESALAHAKLSGDAHTVAVAFRGHERAHLKFFHKAIRSFGATPHGPEKLDFGSATASRMAFLRTSAMVEEFCVETINGAGPLLTKPVLAAAGTLVSVEARQASWVRAILGENAAPFAFNPTLTATQSMARLHKFGFIKQ